MSLYVKVDQTDRPRRWVAKASRWQRIQIMRDCVPFSVSVEILGRGYGFGLRREARDR